MFIDFQDTFDFNYLENHELIIDYLRGKIRKIKALKLKKNSYQLSMLAEKNYL